MGRVREKGQNERVGNEGQEEQILHEEISHQHDDIKRQNLIRKAQKKWKAITRVKKKGISRR